MSQFEKQKALDLGQKDRVFVLILLLMSQYISLSESYYLDGTDILCPAHFLGSSEVIERRFKGCFWKPAWLEKRFWYGLGRRILVN